jgi:hypothetical protein
MFWRKGGTVVWSSALAPYRNILVIMAIAFIQTSDALRILKQYGRRGVAVKQFDDQP